MQDPDPRKMQINLTGFLNGKNARIFMGELWKLLDSAQNNESGIPQEMIDKKKEEIKNRRVSGEVFANRKSDDYKNSRNSKTCVSIVIVFHINIQEAEDRVSRVNESLKKLDNDDTSKRQRTDKGGFGRGRSRSRSRSRSRDRGRRGRSRSRDR